MELDKYNYLVTNFGGLNMFKLEMHFPSGKVEILDGDYLTIEEAKQAGEKMIVQVDNNEQFYDYKDDYLGKSRKIKPYFYVLEVKGRNKKEVYCSK